LITLRPSIFCFLGKLAPDLYGNVPMSVRRRLGVVPDVFAFISVHEDAVDMKIGTRRPKLSLGEGTLQNRFWNALTFAAASIGNIRIRTDALRRPAETDQGFQVVRGGPDVYLVECLSDPLGWEILFAIAEKIHDRNQSPPGAGRARGIFPLFHVASSDEDLEREQAIEGLRRLEALVQRGVLFPSIVLDRVNRNGYPLERWEDLTEMLADFLSLSSASEAAPEIWRIFPQLADLHSAVDGNGGAAGLSALGLGRFRFNRELIGEHLGRLHLRDLKRALHRTLAAEPAALSDEAVSEFLSGLVSRRLSAREDGSREVEAEIIAWVRQRETAPGPPLGVWTHVLDRLQHVLFERLGEVAQRIENARQDNEVIQLESPLRDTWIARLSVAFPTHFFYLPFTLGGAIAGSLLGLIVHGSRPLGGYFVGAVLGGLAGLGAAYATRKSLTRETFTLGEFPESTFTQGFPVPRTLERLTRRKGRGVLHPGLSVQLWGELRSQVEPNVKERIDSLKKQYTEDLGAARQLESELIFLDRSINLLRERVEAWRARLAEVEVWEPGRGFSGDIFPADGPRKIYEWLRGRDAAEAAAAAFLPRITAALDAPALLDMADEASASWGRDQSKDLQFDKVLEILEDRPEDLLERLSEASAPLWPRPGDRDELLRCFGDDFARFAKGADVRHSQKDETIFIRVLGGIRSAELART
jgi:hypothetical protein